MTGILRDFVRIDDLGTVSVLALILLRRYDMTSVDTTEEMGRHIPRARVVVFEDSDRFMFVEGPEEFLSEIRSFLGTPERAVSGTITAVRRRRGRR